MSLMNKSGKSKLFYSKKSNLKLTNVTPVNLLIFLKAHPELHGGNKNAFCAAEVSGNHQVKGPIPIR